MITNQSKYILPVLLLLCSSMLFAQNNPHTLQVQGNEFASEPVITFIGTDLYFDFPEPNLRVAINGVLDYSIGSQGVQMIIDSAFINSTNISVIPGNTLNCNCLTLSYASEFYSTAAGTYLLQGSGGAYGIGMADDTVLMRNLDIHYECPPVMEVQVHSIIPETPTSLGQATISIIHSGLPYNLIAVSPGGVNVFQNQSALGDYTIQSKSGNGFASVLDRFGCSIDEPFTIPLCSIAVTAQIPVPDCDGQISGSLVVTPSNDYAPYQYAWSGPANPGNSPSIFQPAPGTYQVTVTDAIGCTATKMAVVESKLPLALSCQTQNGVSRVGALDGKASISFIGGKLPYRLYWTGPQQGNKQLNQSGTTIITSLPAGEYTFQLVDKDGCSETCTLQIPDVPCLMKWDDVNVLGPSCTGEVDGYIYPQTRSGVGTVSYSLKNGNTVFAGPPYQGLAPDTYVLTATDGLGCRLDTTITLVDPPALKVACSLYFPVNFYNGDNGVIALEIAGGTAPYQVDYQTGDITRTRVFFDDGQQLLDGLVAGDYAITLTDDRGCQIQCSTSVPNFICVLEASGSLRQPDCSQPWGSLSISLQEALEPVTYRWTGPVDPGNVSQSIHLPAGTYAVEITDHRGCRDTVSGEIGDMVSLEVNGTVLQEETGWQHADGQVALSWSGNDTAVLVQLFGPDTLVGFYDAGPLTIGDLAPGNYHVILQQGDSCFAVCDFKIEPFLCSKAYTLTRTDVSCAGQSDGTIGVHITGDSLIYTLILDDTTVYSLDDSYQIRGLGAGIHKIAITLPGGCTFTDELEIMSPDPLNYHVDLQAASDSLTGDGSIQLTILGGTPPYQLSWSDQVNGDYRDGLFAGQYAFTVTDANTCSLEGVINLKSNDLLCAGLQNVVEISPASCFAARDGSVIVQPRNGTAPYSIHWEDGSPDFNRTGLATGIYQYQWVDALGCPVRDSVEVGFREDSLRYVEVVSLCPGTTISWEGQLITEPGSYAHSYLNQSGCDSLVELMVVAIELPDSFQIEVVDPSQCSLSDGSIRVQTDGIYPGQYWLNDQNPSSQPFFEHLRAGTYSISYRMNGCTKVVVDSLILLGLEPAWQVQIDTIYRPICGMTQSGAVRLRLEGVNGDARVLWSNGQEGLFADFLDPGTYQVTITGDPGCFQYADILVPEPEVGVLDLQPKAYTICAGDRLEITLDSSWTYHWSGPDGFAGDTATVVLVSPGTYRIEAWRDGCVSIDSIEVQTLDELFDASFLVPQQVIAGQPFIAVENSWPVPDSIFWEVEGGAEMVGQNLNQLTLQMPVADTSLVRLTAWKGACSVTLEKQIIAYSDTSALSNPFFAPPSEIISARLMPNPNQGVFRTTVTLSAVMPSQLRIYDPQGMLITSRNMASLDSYEASFELTDLQPGLYTLAVQTAGDWKTVPFIIVL